MVTIAANEHDGSVVARCCAGFAKVSLNNFIRAGRTARSPSRQPVQ